MRKNPPDLPTSEEQTELDKMTELEIDDAITEKHRLLEVPILTEGLGEDFNG